MDEIHMIKVFEKHSQNLRNLEIRNFILWTQKLRKKNETDIF